MDTKLRSFRNAIHIQILKILNGRKKFFDRQLSSVFIFDNHGIISIR
jgi:hypothetical protein